MCFPSHLTSHLASSALHLPSHYSMAVVMLSRLFIISGAEQSCLITYIVYVVLTRTTTPSRSQCFHLISSHLVLAFSQFRECPPPPSSQARLGSGRASGPMDDGLMAGCGVSARWGPVVCACIKVRMRKRNVLNLVAAGEDSIINRKGPTARSCRTWPWPPKSLQ